VFLHSAVSRLSAHQALAMASHGVDVDRSGTDSNFVFLLTLFKFWGAKTRATFKTMPDYVAVLAPRWMTRRGGMAGLPPPLDPPVSVNCEMF